MIRGILGTLTLAMTLTVVTSQAAAYEVRAFAGKNRKATIKDFMPKLDRAENKTNKFFAEQYSFAFSPDGKDKFWFQFLIVNMGVSNGKGAVRVHFTPEGGKKIKAETTFARKEWSASKEGKALKIKMGDNVFTGDGKQWKAHFKNKHFEADCTITNSAPAWRPGGGTVYYGKGTNRYYDITLLTPRGTFEADIVMADSGKKYHLTGTVFGDNSVINISPNLQARRWVKTRKIGSKYTVMLTTLQTSEQYGSKWVGYFFVASNKGLVATAVNPKVELAGLETDPKNGYEVPTIVLFSEATGLQGFTGALQGKKRLYRKDQLSSLDPIEKAMVSKLIQPFTYKYKGAYEFKFKSRKGKERVLKGKTRYIFEQFTK